MDTKEMLQCLQELKANGPKDKAIGICPNTDLWDELHKYMRRWPRYSRNPNYPVPHKSLDPHSAYHSGFNIWDRRTNYGRLRWELLDFLIAELQKELANET